MLWNALIQPFKNNHVHPLIFANLIDKCGYAWLLNSILKSVFSEIYNYETEAFTEINFKNIEVCYSLHKWFSNGFKKYLNIIRV